MIQSRSQINKIPFLWPQKKQDFPICLCVFIRKNLLFTELAQNRWIFSVCSEIKRLDVFVVLVYIAVMFTSPSHCGLFLPYIAFYSSKLSIHWLAKSMATSYSLFDIKAYNVEHIKALASFMWLDELIHYKEYLLCTFIINNNNNNNNYKEMAFN